MPHPRLFVDPTWEVADRPKIVRYLRSGAPWLHFLGYSYCRFENGPPPKEMGSSDLSDGAWLWPEGLAVYVERFHVRLPAEFAEHMRRHEFTVREKLSKSTFPEHTLDLSFWRGWCERELKKDSPPTEK